MSNTVNADKTRNKITPIISQPKMNWSAVFLSFGLDDRENITVAQWRGIVAQCGSMQQRHGH